MTDFEQLKNTFDAIGCKYRVITAIQEHNKLIESIDMGGHPYWDTALRLEIAPDSFVSHYPEFYFLKGKFQGQRCWE